MNADEVVKALRCTADAIKVASPVAIIMNGAADLIESLQAQLAAAEERERALEDALLGMVHQFCSDGEVMAHMFMSAEERAYDVLDIKFGESVSDVYGRYEKKWRGSAGESQG